jgi:hypothetical protein
LIYLNRSDFEQVNFVKHAITCAMEKIILNSSRKIDFLHTPGPRDKNSSFYRFPSPTLRHGERQRKSLP